jgi:hypothetical protein
MDHDPSTDATETCVYGTIKSMVAIDETVQDFMKRVKVTNQFGQLTRADGRQVWINGAAVGSLSAANPGEFVDGVKTVVTTAALVQGVRETPSEATDALNARGANL